MWWWYCVFLVHRRTTQHSQLILLLLFYWIANAYIESNKALRCNCHRYFLLRDNITLVKDVSLKATNTSNEKVESFGQCTQLLAFSTRHSTWGCYSYKFLNDPFYLFDTKFWMSHLIHLTQDFKWPILFFCN